MKKCAKIAVLMVLLALWFPGPSWSAASQDPYALWLDSFNQRLKSASLVLNDTDKAALQELIQLKPTQDTGRHFKIWFDKTFLQMVAETGSNLNDYQYEKFAFIIAAKPDGTGSRGFYPTYLKALVAQIQNFLPTFDDSEKKFLDLYQHAVPQADAPGDFQAWLKEFNVMKADFGDNLSDDQTYALEFLKLVKPAEGIKTSKTYEISEETLLEIRTFIMNNQGMAAVLKIDTILKGK